MRLSIIKLSMLSFAATFVSCGKTEQKVDLKSGLIPESEDPNCKRNACKPVNFSIVDGNGAAIETSKLTGSVGVELAWTIKVKIDEAPAKRIKMAVTQAPTWLEKDSKESENGVIILKGKPIEVASKAKIVVLARDISRCTAMEVGVKERSACSDPTVDFSEKGYDKVVPLEYSISQGNSNNGSQNNSSDQNGTNYSNGFRGHKPTQ